MNTVKYNTTEGFPLDTTNLDFLQKSFKTMQAFGELAGDMSIIQGCVETGNQVSDGYVYLNGELLEFRGGNKSTYVIIRETEEFAEFENGENKVIEVTRWVQFGNASQRWAWADFKRPKNLQELKSFVDTELEKSKHTIPVGLISMWAGSIANIPEGWALCNGQNNTPNLSNRFVLGHNPLAIDGDIGEIGGEKEVTLTEAQIPKHKHTGTTSIGGGHSHTYEDSYHFEAWGSTAGSVYGNRKRISTTEVFAGNKQTDHDNDTLLYRNHTTGIDGSHGHTLATEETGGGESHNNMPPYYVLAFIQYKG